MKIGCPASSTRSQKRVSTTVCGFKAFWIENSMELECFFCIIGFSQEMIGGSATSKNVLPLLLKSTMRICPSSAVWSIYEYHRSDWSCHLFRRQTGRTLRDSIPQ